MGVPVLKAIFMLFLHVFIWNINKIWAAEEMELLEIKRIGSEGVGGWGMGEREKNSNSPITDILSNMVIRNT